MKKQYQKSWHEINFTDFFDPNQKKVSDVDFYESFYEKFLKVYSSYEDLPASYIENKMPTIKFLCNKISNKKNILSIGCGLGIIENLIFKELKEAPKIIGVEPSNTALTWIQEKNIFPVYSGYFPLALAECETKFDYSYARAIEYLFNQEEYIEFLKSVILYGIKEFSIISVSPDRRNIDFIVKDWVKEILSTLGLYERGQFWGYLRTPKDHKTAFIEAGFEIVEIEKVDFSTISITGKRKT